eukprot:m.51986 g.51986  ORF g.51986 m.51986 type:complete len:513 (+) comp13471_c0_seq5:121-1659(+)
MAAFAGLPMYDFETVRTAHVTWYTCIRREAIRLGLSQSCLPTALETSDGRSMDEVLTFDPTKMILAQTCGLPLISGYRRALQLLGTPVYTAEGCSGTNYSSVIIASASTTGDLPSDFQDQIAAVNSLSSLSGSLLLSAWLGSSASTVQPVTTGSHAQSLVSVRDPDHPACLASIDAVSFALLQEAHGPDFLDGLRVVGFTPAAPALPYVTSATTSPADVEILKQALHAASISQDPTVMAAKQSLKLSKVDVSGAVKFEDYEARIVALRETLIQQSLPIQYTPPPLTTLVVVEEDLNFLQDLAKLVIATARAEPNRQPHQLSLHELSDERSARLVFLAPPAEALAVLLAPESKPRACVGFVGDRPPQHWLAKDDHCTVDACWATDEELVRNLSADTVVAYCSGQRSPGGDWGNLVVFQAPTPHQGIAAFRTHNPPHARATGSVAPRYYQSVRIHALKVCQDQGDDQVRFTPCRTLQVEYPPPSLLDNQTTVDLKPTRRYHYWQEEQKALFEAT